jgi:hypothetical protein
MRPVTARKNPGRGRPPLFDEAARERYLKARAEPGTTQAQAAAAAGVASRTVRDARRTDPAFKTADEQAAARARAARIEQMPHDESRYKHHGCRCLICTTAATTGRADRRARAADPASVTPITATTERSSRSFPLAVAS